MLDGIFWVIETNIRCNPQALTAFADLIKVFYIGFICCLFCSVCFFFLLTTAVSMFSYECGSFFVCT